MLHCLATEIAVSVLSPVAMIVRILHLLSVEIVPLVAGFSLFSITKNPRNYKFPDSTFSRFII
mgnify:CR=1 FL=1